jgi:amino-acid N-acetyltransferase
LLTATDLPSEGVADHLATALVAREGTSIVASAALEVHGHTALLRSVVVVRTHRRSGLGERMARAALDLAHRRGVRVVYLLTTTAEDFFARRLAFRPIARADVPEAIRGCAEFTRLCPDTARVMVRDVGAAEGT